MMVAVEQITFILAFVGYAGLTTTAVAGARGRLPVRLWRGATLVIVFHVLLVWMVRYEWQLAVAVRNGYVGFILFHAALVMIVASAMVSEPRARALVIVAFVVVSLGAVGAVFRYDVVAVYRAPVILVATAGIVGLASVYFRRRLRVDAV